MANSGSFFNFGFSDRPNGLVSETWPIFYLLLLVNISDLFSMLIFNGFNLIGGLSSSN